MCFPEDKIVDFIYRRNKNRIIVLLVFILIMISFFQVVDASAHTSAQAGKIDLTDSDILDELIDLKGEWEFYWGELLEPGDFHTSLSPSAEYVEVPELWASYEISNQTLPSQGYATYRLTFLLSDEQIEQHSTLGLYFKRIETSYRVWINGIEKGGNGVVGKTPESTTPQNFPQVIYFEAQSGENELVVQVANFVHNHGGMWERLDLGTAELVTYKRTMNVVLQSFVNGLFLMMAIYFIFIYLFRKRETASLIFGLMCLFISIRVMILGESTALYVFQSLSWEWVAKTEYVSISLAAIMLLQFIKLEYPNEAIRQIPKAISISLALFITFVLCTPAIIFTKYIFIFTTFMLLPAILYTLYVYVMSAIHKRKGSISNAIGFAFFFLFALNDILFYNDVIQTGDYLSIGLLFFLFTQSINLSSRFSKALSEAEQLSEQLQESNELLEIKVEERTIKLKQAEMFRTQLLTNISHELGTPITSIKGYSKALRDGIITQDASKYADRIYERTILLERLIDDLVELTKLETRQTHFKFEEIEALPFLSRLYEKYEWEVIDKGLSFSFEERNHLSVNRQAFMKVDPFRIEQVFSNLLTNALKFTPAGKAVRIVLVWKSSEVTIHIIDNGIGIDPAEHERIFQRFHQSKKNEGSGLGLAICKEIIDYHEGELGVVSQINKGSDFYFTLPITYIDFNSEGV